MPESTPKEKFVGDLLGSTLGDWESLLPADVVEEIHDEVAAAADPESERMPRSRPASQPAELVAASTEEGE